LDIITELTLRCICREQDFLNYLSLNDYRNAIQLALAMGQPGRLLSLFKGISSSESASSSSITGHHAVDEVFRTLGGSDLAKLLRYVRDWNANAKTSMIAQSVLFAVVKLRSADDVMKAFKDEAQVGAFASGKGFEGVATGASGAGGTALKELIDALIPYTERHLSRMEKLVQESYMVDYILSEMDDGMFDGELENYDTGAAVMA
jgi:U3 small nucleolar RNA-associated protein 13